MSDTPNAELPLFRMPTCRRHFFSGHRWWCRPCDRETERQMRDVCVAYWRAASDGNPMTTPEQVIRGSIKGGGSFEIDPDGQHWLRSAVIQSNDSRPDAILLAIREALPPEGGHD